MKTSEKKYTFKRIFGKLSQWLARNFPLMPSFFRIFLYRRLGVNFTSPKTVFIGEDVYFDDSRPELIRVGQWVRITSGAKIFTHFFDTQFIPEKNRPFRFYDGKVTIEDYVFIGSNVVIAKPVTIGKWAVIGANTVITRDVPERAIMVGSPAKQVGERSLSEVNSGCTSR